MLSPNKSFWTPPSPHCWRHASPRFQTGLSPVVVSLWFVAIATAYSPPCRSADVVAAVLVSLSVCCSSYTRRFVHQALVLLVSVGDPFR
ncbi:hypothetical protein DFJ73DRAFT_817237 [Zopfochytrium polystomum]|nr:hypothetical protein DFJ73DRAFT_817237 [Zopfochytrium polystomum]